MNIDFAGHSAWAMDFIRAMQNRPLIIKIIFQLCMGRYAYREFIGLMDALDRDSFSPYFSYHLEHLEYHNDEMPKWWWSERKLLSKKKK